MAHVLRPAYNKTPREVVAIASWVKMEESHALRRWMLVQNISDTAVEIAFGSATPVGRGVVILSKVESGVYSTGTRFEMSEDFGNLTREAVWAKSTGDAGKSLLISANSDGRPDEVAGGESSSSSSSSSSSHSVSSSSSSTTLSSGSSSSTTRSSPSSVSMSSASSPSTASSSSSSTTLSSGSSSSTVNVSSSSSSTHSASSESSSTSSTSSYSSVSESSSSHSL